MAYTLAGRTIFLFTWLIHDVEFHSALDIYCSKTHEMLEVINSKHLILKCAFLFWRGFFTIAFNLHILISIFRSYTAMHRNQWKNITNMYINWEKIFNYNSFLYHLLLREEILHFFSSHFCLYPKPFGESWMDKCKNIYIPIITPQLALSYLIKNTINVYLA